MSGAVSDEEIVAAWRSLYPLVEERERAAAVVERLREATDPGEVAERDRCGERMAELDERIVRGAAQALDRIGLWHVARLIDSALEDASA
ncbi:hypothetical protein MTQ10_25750 [Streptomyces sp. XM83C]|uniref:Uncharacterized protein n=1 Tax=Streptomyces thermocoprophilus TaxID=78356 RepID=A0ABV5VLS4_9ACTN|nr:hypothetical protein [Streptomyces sp. XM83C]MCK1822910.1 hypothetical protein [Streptomyces sp. XM83C]